MKNYILFFVFTCFSQVFACNLCFLESQYEKEADIIVSGTAKIDEDNPKMGIIEIKKLYKGHWEAETIKVKFLIPPSKNIHTDTIWKLVKYLENTFLAHEIRDSFLFSYQEQENKSQKIHYKIKRKIGEEWIERAKIQKEKDSQQIAQWLPKNKWEKIIIIFNPYSSVDTIIQHSDRGRTNFRAIASYFKSREEAREYLINNVRARHQVKGSLAHLMRQKLPEDIIYHCLEMINTEDFQLQQVLLITIGQSVTSEQSSKVLSVLVPMVDKFHPKVVWFLFLAIRDTLRKAEKKIVDEILYKIISRFGMETHENRLLITELIGSFASYNMDCIRFMDMVLRGHNKEIKLEALRKLQGNKIAPELKPVIILTTSDDNEKIRENGLEILKYIEPDSELIDILIHCLYDDSLDIQKKAIEILQKYREKSQKAVPILLKLKDQKEIWHEVLQALHAITGEKHSSKFGTYDAEFEFGSFEDW